MAFVNGKFSFSFVWIFLWSRFKQMFQLLAKQGNAKYDRNCIPVVYSTRFLFTS